ncbi:MAG: transcriptional regulator, LysR family, partial [Rhodospirillales bacterium]|nr:transcriptional regulator, LysR family [Rhodospirillales bacterium]
RSVCNSLTNLLVAVRAGLGLAPLPCLLEYESRDLVRCFLAEGYNGALYLVIPEDLRDTPRIRAFSAFIVARTAGLRHVMEGRMAER